ncbi:hypothetical protein F2Q69_00014298 [Brassica cretica]|uniref:Uncharacterized protein n=1 Tax=Brassica cretica TaxID=69181 RepID=A0A8S9R8W7_BRACR|nr:hypothetical protein F2Q69_00014298 [Brassica cretica]
MFHLCLVSLSTKNHSTSLSRLSTATLSRWLSSSLQRTSCISYICCEIKVTNYYVIAKLATDQSGLQRCKISLVDATGTRFTKDGKIVGLDPDNDLAVLKIDGDNKHK